MPECCTNAHMKFGISGPYLTRVPRRNCDIEITPTKQQSGKTTLLHDTAYLVNDLIHKEIDGQCTAKSSPISFDIDSELQQMNPLLLNFMNSITLTIRERKYPTLEKQTPKESTNMQHFGTTTILHKSQSTTIVSRSYCRRQF